MKTPAMEPPTTNAQRMAASRAGAGKPHRKGLCILGGFALVVLVIYALLGFPNLQALHFLLLGPNPAPGKFGVYAVSGGNSIVLNRAIDVEAAQTVGKGYPEWLEFSRFSAVSVSGSDLLLVVYGARPDNARLLPVTHDGHAYGYSQQGETGTAVTAFEVSRVPLFEEMYLARPLEAIPSGEWVLSLPSGVELSDTSSDGPAYYMLRVH